MCKVLVAAAIVLVFSLTGIVTAQAQVAVCTTTGDTRGFVGETGSFSITIANSDAATGFRPGIDLFLPAGLSFNAATFAGTAVTASAPIIVPASGNIVHPLTGEIRSGTVGESFVFLSYAVTAQPQSMPGLTMDVVVDIDSGATVGTALGTSIECGYLFGSDAINDPLVDVPVRTSAANSVTPVLVTVTKTAPPAVCTGASYEFDWLIDIDVADGQQLDAFSLSDEIPGTFRIVLVDPDAGTVTSLPPGPAGGTLEISYPNLVGAPGVDASIVITGFVVDGTINPAAPVQVAVENNVRVGGFVAPDFDLSANNAASTLPAVLASAATSAGAIQVRETITTGPFQPDDTATIVLEICVSDDNAIDDVAVSSLLGDGLTFVPGSGDFGGGIAETSVVGTGPTTVVYNLGDLNAGSTAALSYEATVNQDFVGTGDPVRAGDSIGTTHNIDGVMATGGAAVSVVESASIADASAVIIGSTFAKTTTTPVDGDVVAGEVVTFDLLATFPTGDIGVVVLTDFLPKPIFDATECVVTQEADTNFAAPVVVRSPLANDNFIRLTFPAIESATNVEARVHFSVTCTVQNGPADDGFVFTNVAQIETNNTATSATDFAFTALTFDVPELTILKATAGTNVDAGDTVNYSITIANTGNADAFGIVVRDLIPTGLTVAGPPTITGASFVGTPADLFSGTGVEISTLSAGAAIISYTVTVDNNTSSNSNLVNTASVLNFGSEAGGANHALPAASFSSSESVTISRFVPDNDLADLVDTARDIGEDYLYNSSIEVPEGLHDDVTFTYSLDAGLVFIDTPTIDMSAVTCGPVAGPFGACTLPVPVISADNRTVTWTFSDANGNAINNPPALGPEEISFVVRAGVSTTANRGDNLNTRLSVTGNDSNSQDVRIIEPLLEGAGVFTGTGDGGDTIALTTTFQHSGPSDSDAHDGQLVYEFAGTGLSPVANATLDISGCVGATSAVASGTTIVVQFDPLLVGSVCSIPAAVVIDNGVTNGSQLSVPADLTWESLSGDGNFEAIADERSYLVEFNALYNVATGAINKVLLSTTRPETTGANVAVGEQASYRIDVTVPDGSNPATIVCDDPPSGLAIIGFTVDTSTFVGTITAPAAPVSGGQGQELCWDFGTVLATSGIGTLGNSFSIGVMTQATFVSGMATGSPENTATLAIGGSAQATNNADVVYALPTPIVALAANDTSPEAGDTVDFTASLTNSVDGPVCDTTVTVTIPAGFSIANFASDGLDNDLDGATDEADEATLVSGSVITFPVDATNTPVGCLEGPQNTLVFPFRVTVDAGIAPSSINASATLANYGSLANGEGETIDPADDDTDNNGSGAIDEVGDATRTLSFIPAAPSLLFTKAVTAGPIEPNDRLTYTITMSNTGTGAARGITISDTIPSVNAVFVAGSETITPASEAVVVAGGIISSDIGDLAAGNSVVVTFQVDVNSPLPVGSEVSNQASATADDGYGPLVSDNPATAVPNDATVIATVSTDDPDGDGVCTGAVAVPGVCIAGPDANPTDPNLCADVDGDGCDDCTNEFPPNAANDGSDIDGDGACDLGDIDVDNDGIPNTAENALGIDPLDDEDGDGVLNFEDADDQGNGDASNCVNVDGDPDTCDLLSDLFDTDQDGVPDYLDLDADNDGIADVIEAGHGANDLDGDGMVDGPYNLSGIAEAVDADDDQVIDYAIRDTDGDNTPDFQDTDSDNDGLTDIEESGGGNLDTDNDGRIDDFVDADDDGLDDNVDDDDNVYGNPSLDIAGLIAGFDTDGDGIPDPYDADDDGTGGDSNNDGFDDAIQCENPPGWPACPDADGDGTPDYSEPLDTDGDGVSDANDIDTDNDGIPDVDETALGFDPYADADGDGIPNYLDADDRGDGMPQLCLDANTDNECEVPGADYDSDGDGIANQLDLDSDNDGIPDVIEAGHGRDGGEGFVDCPAGFGDNGLCDDVESAPDSDVRNYPILNTDGAVEFGDDVPDFLDIDSDADGDFDIAEVDALAGLDGDNDGRIDDATDVDADGILSGADADDDTRGFPGTTGDPTATDTDADGIPDAYDADDTGRLPGDSDGDGLPDDVECNGTWPCQDIDGDGIPDYMELADADEDGIPDFIDLDDDNDGIKDSDESLLGLDGSLDNDNDGIPNAIDTDDRGDGMPNDCEDTDGNGACEAVGSDFDFDGDGIANHFDLDADGDGIYDADESGFDAADTNRDGVLDCDGGVGVNGLCDEVETGADSGNTNEVLDSDNDDAPDFLDVDSDGDTILDSFEAGDDDLSTPPIDTDGDGDPDTHDLDTDGDSIPDEVEAVDDDLDTDPIDTDGDGTPDFRDLDSDNDEIIDEEETGDDPTDPVDTDGDGLPDYRDVDSDNDGVDDDVDNCRLDSNAEQVDSDQDGFGQACDVDDIGDGYDDDIGLSGGGCSTSGGSSAPWMALMLVALFAGLRRRKNAIGAVVVVAVCFGMSNSAFAQPDAADTEYSVERFRLSTDRQGILDVESAKVPKHLSFDIGLWLGYADDPLTLYRSVNGERERIGSAVSHRLGGALVGSFALYERFQIGLSVPLVLSQDNDVSDIMGAPSSISSVGLGDLRVVPKVQLLRNEHHWLDLAISLGFTIPTGTSSDYFGDSSGTLQPEILLSKPISDKLRVGLNLGYRVRKKQEALNLTVDDELYSHLGAAYMVTSKLELDATVSAATGSNDILGDFNRNFSEVRAGAAYYVANMVLFVGTGVGTSAGFGTPDWRALTGVRFGRLRDETEKTPIPVVKEPADLDGDGLIGDEDKCPEKPENFNSYEDEDGCPETIPDTDGDGLNDIDDSCPKEAEDVDTFEDTNGCPDPDNDSDSVLDVDDDCPLVAGLASNKGCPETDSDGDGIPDAQDNCPNEPGDAANAGCKTKQVVTITAGKIDLLDKVYFRTNKAVIREVSYDLLKNVATVLNNHPEISIIVVEGHTDSRGRPAYNKKLSQRRAESVVAFLVKEGVAKERLSAIGYGAEKPIKTNDTDEGRAANRRVAFKIGDAAGIKEKNSGPTKDTIGE